jgi:prepilin peptidase CpaA
LNWPSLSFDALTALQAGVIFGACLIALIWDLSSRRIPNWLTVPMLATGLIWSTWMRGPWGFLDALAAALILALPYVLLFVFAGGGGGDVKLMAAIGAWTGVLTGLLVLIMVAGSGVLMGIAVAMARGQFRAVMGRVTGFAYHAMPIVARRAPLSQIQPIPIDAKTSPPMPYGVAIFAGVCMAMGGLFLWHA